MSLGNAFFNVKDNQNAAKHFLEIAKCSTSDPIQKREALNVAASSLFLIAYLPNCKERHLIAKEKKEVFEAKGGVCETIPPHNEPFSVEDIDYYQEQLKSQLTIKIEISKPNAS